MGSGHRNHSIANAPPPTSHFRRNEGFTLLEIMVSVAIVGILASIAVPGYTRYVDKTREAAAIVHIQGIASSLRMATVENPDTLPENAAAFADFCRKYDLPTPDPWGRPYEYLRIYNRPGNENAARKNRATHPINSYFDLYSKGLDGASSKPLTAGPSQDDIIYADDGAFIGRVSSYPDTST